MNRQHETLILNVKPIALVTGTAGGTRLAYANVGQTGDDIAAVIVEAATAHMQRTRDVFLVFTQPGRRGFMLGFLGLDSSIKMDSRLRPPRMVASACSQQR